MLKKIILLISLLSVSTPSLAFTIDKIVVFGDSLSDNGNIYRFTLLAHKILNFLPIIPESPPYFPGRFSNGPIWDEILARYLNLSSQEKSQFENFSYGGSWAEPLEKSMQNFPPDLFSQIEFFRLISETDFQKEKHLYLLWIGGNDYLNGRDDIESSTSETVGAIQKGLHALLQQKAKYLVIFNLPNLGLTPSAKNKGSYFVDNLTQLSKIHNLKLSKMVAEEKKNHPNIKIILINIENIFNDLYSNPKKYQINELYRPCYINGYELANEFNNYHDEKIKEKLQFSIINNPSFRESIISAKQSDLGYQPCSNPNDYLFWDHVHPTTKIHKIISQLVLMSLKENGLSY